MNLFDSVTEILQKTYLGNTFGRWISALLAVVATLIVLRIARRIAIRRATALAKKTETEIDDFIVDLLNRTRSLFLLALAIFTGTRFLTLSESLGATINKIVIILCLLQVALWGNGMITFWVKRYVRARMTDDAASVTTISALGFMSRIVLWAVILLLALDNLGINITALVAGLGIGGIAVALAAQNILGDLFASLSIVLDKPFILGETIFVGEFIGTVEHIGLKTTRLRSLSGELVVFANSDLLQSRIRNFKRMAERRVVFTIGVTYQTTYEKLAAIPGIIKEYIEAQPNARFDRAHFKAYGNFSLNFEAVFYVTSPDYVIYMDTQQAINLALFQRFQQEGIVFAYPTQTLFLVNERAAEEKVPADKERE